MSPFFKIVIVIFALAYFFSPVDILPDFFLPYIGYLDDLGIIGIVLYVLRYGRLPVFFPDKIQNGFNTFKRFYSQSSQEKMKGASKSSFGKNNSRSTNSTKTDNPNPKSVSPYSTLGIAEGSSTEQIQAAYKEAVKKYHPDKVSHLGPEFKKLANDKFVEIQAAYDFLMKNK